jgi:outer membrane lipoprotein SlyB
MALVLGSFETQSQAEDAIDQLNGLGIGDADVSLVSHASHPVGAPEDDDQRANTQVDFAVAGGAAGAILGGLLLGPIGAVAGGLLAGGGLAAALRPHGATHEEAAEYERRLHEGRYVLAVRVDTDERADEVRRVVAAAGADDVNVDP